RFIKVAYVDHGGAPPPRVVLWETHLTLSGLDTEIDVSPPSIRDMKDKLVGELPSELRGLQWELYFASRQLGKERAGAETLRLYLAVYCDKIYAVPTLEIATVNTWGNYTRYFADVGSRVIAIPSLYVDLCRNLRSLFAGPGKIDSDGLYRHLVLLR